MKKTITLLFTLVFTTIFAHGIWVEVINKGRVGTEATVHLYFGEINRGLKEEGLKYYEGDMFKDFKVLTKPQGSSQTEELTPKASEISLAATFTPKVAGIHQIVAFNEESPVRDLSKHGRGIVKGNVYLRTIFEATERGKQQEGKIDLSPMMKYDIVPFPAKNGFGDYDSHTSFWRNSEKVYGTFYIDLKPAADKEIKVVSPDGWSVIRKTNDKGEFNFTPYKEGKYQAVYQSSEKKKGTFKGTDYDSFRVKAVTLFDIK